MMGQAWAVIVRKPLSLSACSHLASGCAPCSSSKLAVDTTLPRRGDRREWQHTQDYWHEKDEIPFIDLDGSEFVYNGMPAGLKATEAA